MLRYAGRSTEALWRRNTASAAACTSAVQTKYAAAPASAANVYHDEASGDADANSAAEADS